MNDLLNLWLWGLYDAVVTFRLASLARLFAGYKVTFHLDLLAPCTRTGSAFEGIVTIAIRVPILVPCEHRLRLV